MTETLTSEMAYFAADGFGVSLRDDPGEILLTIRGEADIATAPLLALALTAACEAGCGRVIVDLSALDFIDAGCIRLIADSRRRLRARARGLCLRSPVPFVHRVLTLCDMEQLIE